MRIPPGPLSARDLLKNIEVLPLARPASIQWLLRDNGEKQGLALSVVNQTPPRRPDEDQAPWTGAPDTSRRAFLEQAIATERASLSGQSAEGRAMSLETIVAVEAELEQLDSSEEP